MVDEGLDVYRDVGVDGFGCTACGCCTGCDGFGFGVGAGAGAGFCCGTGSGAGTEAMVVVTVIGGGVESEDAVAVM